METDHKTLVVPITRFISTVTVIDPDFGGEVEIEIHKDPVSGGIFGLDASFAEQVNDVVPSVFNKGTMLKLGEA